MLSSSHVPETVTLNQTMCTEFKLSSVDGLFSTNPNNTPPSVQLIVRSINYLTLFFYPRNSYCFISHFVLSATQTTKSRRNQYLWLSEASNMNQSQSITFLNNGVEYNITNATGASTFEIWLDTEMMPSTIYDLTADTTPYTTTYPKFMLTHKVNAFAEAFFGIP